MTKEALLSSLRDSKEKKVGFSLKIPLSLKDKLFKFSKEADVSMNTLIVFLIDALLNDRDL